MSFGIFLSFWWFICEQISVPAGWRNSARSAEAFQGWSAIRNYFYYRIQGNIPVSSKIMAISSIMVGLQWIYISHGPGLTDSPISVLDIHYTEYIQKNKKQIGNVINNLS